MEVFGSLGREYEQVVFAHDPPSGLRTIVCVYSTARGPALGGTRWWPFATEDAAFADVLRLAKAMAFKAAAAGLDLGGGKAVIIGDPARDRSRDLLHAYARVVEGMAGAYITTADVGSTMADLDVIAEATRFVTGTSRGAGDPSPVTSYGVWHGLQAVAEEVFGEPTLEGRHVVVQGTGKVGSGLARRLAESGARLTVSDLRADTAVALAAEIDAETVPAGDALSTPCDILAPCALGPVVTAETVGAFRCRAVAGAANNQLERPEHAHALAEAGILYAPDYVLNAGGLINVEDELHGYHAERAHKKAAGIADTMREVFARAREEGVIPAEAADRMAGERIREAERRREADRGR